jgi:hypothetical protein
MRTTIEMKPEHRARLLELAATRGGKGFSDLVAEALDLYFETQKHRKTAIRNALKLKGCMSETDGEAFRAETEAIRANWR